MTDGRARGWRPVAVWSAAAVLLLTLTAAQRPADAARAPSWHVIKTFTVRNTFLEDVVGFRGGTAWAGGSSPAETPVLYHLVGKTWQPVSLPGPAGTFVTNLSATSTANVWASLAGEPLVAHLTSGGWVTTSFAKGTDDIGVSGVVTTGPKDTWAFTYDFTTKSPVAEHFNGSVWAKSPLPALVDCDCEAHAVSASSPDNIWAWVYDPAIKGFATMRWNGHRWQIIKLPPHVVPAGQSVGAEQMLAQSASEVWATADNQRLTGSIILLHWNGHAWAKIAGKLPKGQLAGPIASDGSGGLWLIGRTPALTYFILHYARGHWTSLRMPTSSVGEVVLSALRLIAGTTTVLGAGNLSPSIAGDNGAVIIEYGR
jgi:hypothetical protein